MRRLRGGAGDADPGSWPCAAALCEPAAARLVSLQGTVELQLAGTNVWTPATLGQALCLGDALRVGRASRAALALANDSTLRLDERTTLQLRGVAEEQRSLIDLILGGVYFFSHRPRALEVDTPFVNAAAEGTEFLVRVGADRAECGDAGRPGAAAQSARRAAGRERRCRADPGGARRRSRWWWRGRAMPWRGRCTIRRS